MAETSPQYNGKSRALSALRIWGVALVSSSFVLVVSLIIQWVIYDDWLHETGPLRIVGTCFAALLTFAFVYRWLLSLRQHEEQMLRRFDTIAAMNDRIRNALQVIEVTTYASAPEATEHVRNAVELIDEALRGVVAEARVPSKKPATVQKDPIRRQSKAGSA